VALKASLYQGGIGSYDRPTKRKIIIITADAGRWPTPAEVLPGGSHAAVIMATKVVAQEMEDMEYE